MSKVATFILSIVLSVGAVASAQEVQAPSVKAQYVLMPDKGSLPKFAPVVDPLVQAIADERARIIAEAEAGGNCPQWAGLAFDIGWPSQEIPRLLAIMHRESRCLPEACSESDSGRVCRDWGLMQINDHSWKRTITGQGYVMSDMWNPEHNLRFALWLYRYSEDRNGDGWQPWEITDKPT